MKRPMLGLTNVYKSTTSGAFLSTFFYLNFYLSKYFYDQWKSYISMFKCIDILLVRMLVCKCLPLATLFGLSDFSFSSSQWSIQLSVRWRGVVTFHCIVIILLGFVTFPRCVVGQDTWFINSFIRFLALFFVNSYQYSDEIYEC